jgi:DNA-binding transcriptional LysR family regulator
MMIRRSDIADLTYFLALAQHQSFRTASIELGVSASALSHALKGLEARLGVRLMNRTSRSVALTAAGEELRDSVEQPIAAIADAFESLNRFRDTPTGQIRINASADAVILLLAPVLGEFRRRYPDIGVEVAAVDMFVDIVKEGYDAGIRHDGTVPEDMIAQRLSADFDWVVAAAPAYIERYGRPQTPYDLKGHHCIAGRTGTGHLYRWEFDGPEGEFSVAVPSQTIMGESRSMLALALDGTGLVYGPKPIFDPYLRTGELENVLPDWVSTGSSYHVYYPSRRQVPIGLRLLIDLIREMRPIGL